MNVLVTGGAGYIGSHTAKALAAAGHNPVVFDNLSTGHPWAVQWGPLIVADLSSRAAIRDALRGYRIEAVLHFAADSLVGDSIRHPRRYFRNNLVSTINLLDAMKESGVGRLVFSSTCATYGLPQSATLDETHPQMPLNPYGETKLAIERALHWCSAAGDLRYVALRYFNAAGASPDGDLREDHDPETHLIPLVLDAALDSTRPVSIFGTDYPTADGTAVRDYIHVTDLADAHVRALDYLGRNEPSAAFNLGTGRGYSVLDIVEEVEAVTGRRVARLEANRRAGDPPRLVASASRAFAALEWVPRHSALDEIIRSAWQAHAGRRTAPAANLTPQAAIPIPTGWIHR